MRLEDLGLIGNCQFSALIDRRGAVVWSCLPRFDSEPIFGALLDEAHGGHFTVGASDGSLGTQRYQENSNVLETRFDTRDGAFRVIDFAPRFMLHGRIFRPTQLYRLIEPIEGTPRIAVCCAPRLGWSKAEPARLLGLASHPVRRLCIAGAFDDGPTPVLPGWSAVLADRAPALGDDLGHAHRGAVRAAVRPISKRDVALLAELGQAL
jgi:hypothetical protein